MVGRVSWLGVWLLGALMCAAPSFADAPLFASDAPIAFTLEAPFARLIARAPTSIDPWPGEVQLAEPGAPSFLVQVTPRGMSRRIGGFCAFPPLALSFDRAVVPGTLFEGQGRLKLVSFCKPAANYEQFVVREYLAYRLYNIITPMSFKVRAANVTYHDTQTGRDDRTRFAFLIEGIDDLARRNDRAELEVVTNSVGYAQLDPQATTRAALFEYMIGNLDWDFVSGVAGEKCCHNIKLMALAGAVNALVPTPYDFDYSGFVNTPYALPPDNVPVRTVRTRYYRGLCRFKDQLPEVIAHFRAHRGDMTALIAGEVRLDEANRRETQAYLDSFFAVLDSPGDTARAFTSRCTN